MPPKVDGVPGNIDALKEQIQDGLVTSISQRRFLPIDKLHEILTFAAIESAVEELTCGPEDRIKLTETIYSKGRAVFAMLIHNDWQNLITKFRKHGALDDKLPLSENKAIEIAGRLIGRRLANDVQWGFCPYMFPESMWNSDCDVEREIILPFIEAEQIDSGAFSTVEKICISPSQQHFVDKGVECLQVDLLEPVPYEALFD